MLHRRHRRRAARRSAISPPRRIQPLCLPLLRRPAEL